MGQRCFILVKRNFKDNESTIDLIHHQWGIGKTLGALFLEQLLKCVYGCDRNKSYQEDYVPAKDEFTFEPLSNERNNYIYQKKVATNDKKYDIWNKKSRIELGNMCDNNNGGMVIELTQNYDEKGKPRTYGDVMDIKIGFCLGDEETDYCNKHLENYIAIEKPFERIVTCREFVERTSNGRNESNELFISSFNKLCKLFDIRQVNNKKATKKIKDRWKTVETIMNTYTKGLKENEMIDTPKELLESVAVYK